MNILTNFRENWRTWREMPALTIDLQLREAVQHGEFFERITREFYQECTTRHPKLPLISYFTHGVCLLELPKNFDDYFMLIDASARRNYKKAGRNGYSVQRIDFNDHLQEIGEIRRSAPVRQGKLSQEFLTAEITPIVDPPSDYFSHGYPYYGTMKDGKLVAYAGLHVAGEFAMMAHVYGHDAYLSDGVVPMLVIDMARELIERYPAVKYYAYGSWFGATTNLKRFKKKFRFEPHRVTWKLGEQPLALA